MSSNRLNFLVLASILAAVGCGGDSMTLTPIMGGTGAPGPAAGTGTTAAGTGTPGTAGTGIATAGTGVAQPPTSAAGTGAATAGTGAATAGTGAATAGTGAATAGTGAATAGTGAAPAAVTLTALHGMLWSKCALCHAMPAGANANGMLGAIKSKDEFYNAVVNKPVQGPMCMGKGMYVVPGKPEMSVLLQKLKDPAPCGSQMPVGNPLDDAEIKMVSDWIAGGAKND